MKEISHFIFFDMFIIEDITLLNKWRIVVLLGFIH